jgi:hypothetical protein
LYFTVPVPSEDREGVRIPLDENLTLLDSLAVAHLEPCAVDDRVALAIAPLRVLDDERPGAVHDDQLARLLLAAALRFNDLQTLVANGAGVLVERGLLGYSRCRSTDVERSHRQPRARLADRLRRDDADGEAKLHQASGREVAPVALRAAATAAGAREHRADADLLDTAFLDIRGPLLVDLVVDVDDDVARERVDDSLERDTIMERAARPQSSMSTTVGGHRCRATSSCHLGAIGSHLSRA